MFLEDLGIFENVGNLSPILGADSNCKTTNQNKSNNSFFFDDRYIHEPLKLSNKLMIQWNALDLRRIPILIENFQKKKNCNQVSKLKKEKNQIKKKTCKINK